MSLYCIDTEAHEGKNMVREYTNKLRDLLDEGMITADAVVDMALAYMSEDDVKDMCRANDLCLNDDELEEDEIQFYVAGDVGLESECILHEADSYDDAVRFANGYLKDGTYGGYKYIEIGFYDDENEWFTSDLYSPEGDDHA